MPLCSRNWRPSLVTTPAIAAMLEGVEAVMREFRRVRMTVNAEHAAVMFGVILHRAC